MASSLTLDRLSEMFNARRTADILCTHRTAILSTLGAAVALHFAINDYLTFLSYGPGGLPYNVGGWLIANVLGLFRREQLSTAPYDNPKLPFTDEPGFLPANFPPQRSSSRPKLGPHAIPQRQLDQLPSAEVRQELIKQFAALGKKAQQKGLVEIKQSGFERQHSALFVSKMRDWHAWAQQTGGEITHVHAGLDGSIHVVLHPLDCKRVIERGWGQRHAFSGSGLMKELLDRSLPITYTLIYAPRDAAELDTAMAIVKASILFMTGTREALE